MACLSFVKSPHPRGGGGDWIDKQMASDRICAYCVPRPPLLPGAARTRPLRSPGSGRCCTRAEAGTALLGRRWTGACVPLMMSRQIGDLFGIVIKAVGNRYVTDDPSERAGLRTQRRSPRSQNTLAEPPDKVVICFF